LLLGRSEAAVDALRVAAEKAPQDPMNHHALGLAYAERGEWNAAQASYAHALTINANHIATIIDRARLRVRQADPEAQRLAQGELLGVSEKLVDDCSASQVARAKLGLTEWRLARGELSLARENLSDAARRTVPTDYSLWE
jgi:Tfp pilus assembly protein PilF